MRIIVGDVDSKIVSKDRRVLSEIRQICRARPKGYKFMPRYRSGSWDGYISLMSSFSTFPTGLLGFVVDDLREKGYTVYIDWNGNNSEKYTSDDIDPDCLVGITLRDYQISAVMTMLNAGRGIAQMATNSGKTEIISAMIHISDVPSLVIVNRKDVLHQTADRLQTRLNVPIGMIGDGLLIREDITVAMIQTLVNVDYTNCRAIYIDECHHGSSAQYMTTLTKLPGKLRYGFSGTPLKNDLLSDMRLMSMTGRVICELSNDYMISAGYSAKPIIHMHEIISDDEHLWKLPYHDAYEKLIVHNTERNIIIKELAIASDGVVFIIVGRIIHGQILNDIIPDSIFVNGNDTSEYRKSVLNKMKTIPGVYIATNIYDEGVDVPSISIYINAVGGRAEHNIKQRVGRGLRKKSGDNVIQIHDFIDDTNEYLLDHSESRIDVYVEEGFEVVLQATVSDDV